MRLGVELRADWLAVELPEAVRDQWEACLGGALSEINKVNSVELVRYYYDSFTGMHSVTINCVAYLIKPS